MLGVCEALVRAKVPIEVAGLFRATGVVGAEAETTGRALVRLSVVESVDKVWAEQFEVRCCRRDAGLC